MVRIARNVLKLGVKFLIFFICVSGIVLYLSNLWVIKNSEGVLYDNIDRIPENDVGLVLGTSRYLGKGYINPYFQNRIDAAAALYHTGKVKHLIVSGDNRQMNYNEPIEMKKALMERGVPEKAITLDYAGFRTLDSVVRCKEIFSQSKVTVISQAFHNERALFICRYYNMEAIGFNAKNVPEDMHFKVKIREVFARTKAVLDLYVLHEQPHFLGEKVNIEIS